jgi:hypothetical protein
MYKKGNDSGGYAAPMGIICLISSPAIRSTSQRSTAFCALNQNSAYLPPLGYQKELQTLSVKVHTHFIGRREYTKSERMLYCHCERKNR